jgi:hypothetical protein
MAKMRDSRTMAEQCQAKARSGKPCSAQVVDGRYCAWHSSAPEWIEKRKQWSAKGGAQRSNKSRARKALPDALTPAELVAVLSAAITGVLAGRIQPGPVNAAANAARAIAVLREASELEQRISALELATGERKWG